MYTYIEIVDLIDIEFMTTCRCVKYDAVRRKDVCVEKKCIEISNPPALWCTSRGVICCSVVWGGTCHL